MVMKKRILFVTIIAFLFFHEKSLSQSGLTRETRTLLEVVAGINFTFKEYSKEIWPGYDLSSQPYLVYIPGDFVLYLNYSGIPKGFKAYPEEWPFLGEPTAVRFGSYKNLVGQFAFDFQVDSIKTFAMGLPKDLIFSLENPAYSLMSTIIHEGFHQYQRNHFGEIPWAREEFYPILNVQNTALASLEMHILKDALKFMFKNNLIKMKELLKEFLAVRSFRWKKYSKFIMKYEQGQEINEGTARYVEMKSIECFFRIDTTQINNILLKKIRKEISGLTIERILNKDFNARMSGLAVAPENMLRNRIYPVGAALGFLLDKLKIKWKMKFQAAGSEISFPGLLTKYFSPDSAQLAKYLAKAKLDYDYQKIFDSAKHLINKYFKEYRKALAIFNNQPGLRIEIDMTNNGIQRFRSSKEKKWIVENGKKTLCLNYNLYSLKSLTGKDLLLEIHDKALFDVNDWNSRRKKIVFFVGRLNSLFINNKQVNLSNAVNRKFNEIKLGGEKFKFTANRRGKIFLLKNKLRIYLE